MNHQDTPHFCTSKCFEANASDEERAMAAAELGDPVATDRREDEPCQRGTVGCSVDHQSDSPCETW